MSPWRAGACVAALAACQPGVAAAAELRSLEVGKDGDVYRLDANLSVSAPADAVYAVLVDYERFERLSSVFEESRVIKPIGEDGTGEVYLRMKGCVLFFCKRVDLAERVEVEPRRLIAIEVIPERSDLEYGRGEWRLSATEQGTEIEYLMEMTPDFWIPPGIGPWVIRHVLQRRVPRAAQRLEHLARGEPIPDSLAVSR